MTFDPWAIDPESFSRLMSTISEHQDTCVCDTCTFVNLIPTMLDAAGAEPVR